MTRNTKSVSALTLLTAITLFISCSQAPENCGDGQKLDSRTQFCKDSKTWDKCGGSEYDPYGQFCNAGKLYDKCNGDNFDPVTHFCNLGKVLPKCGGETYDPASQGCVFGDVLKKCGVNHYSDASQVCESGKVYDKPYNPATSKPVCGTETFDPSAQFCNGDKVYAKRDGQEFDPASPGNGAQSVCGTANYDGAKSFCYAGTVYPLCGGLNYNPTAYTCENGKITDGAGTPNVPGDTGIPSGTKYLLVVDSDGNGASGDGEYPAGTKVTIKAGTRSGGYSFRYWYSANDNVIFADKNSETTTITMPAGSATVKAHFVGNGVEVGSFTDNRDQKKYATVKIGEQVWMGENLNYAVGGSWCYDDKPDSCAKYGRLYDWTTAVAGSSGSNTVPSGVKGICPSGFHLPSRAEWDTLFTAVGGVNVAGKSLKANNGWYANRNGADGFGFSALPGGQRKSNSSFDKAGYYGYWWSATGDSNSENADDFYIGYDNDDYIIIWVGINKNSGLSVRCVQDK